MKNIVKLILTLIVTLTAASCMKQGTQKDTQKGTQKGTQQGVPQFPVIGIYTQADEYDEPAPPGFQASYISSAYVKFIEMSGAQVVPLFAFGTNQSLLATLNKVNGVLFTGGAGEDEIDIENQWTRNAYFVLQYAINEGKNNRSFPIWGTCLGLELLTYLTSGFDSSVLQLIRGDQRVINTLEFQSEKSTLYDGLDATLRTKLSKGQGILFFNHQRGLKETSFRSSRDLSLFWKATTLTTSPLSDKFVSTLESINYPIYAVQFHPEKNLYEWKVAADRTSEGAQIAQILSNQFMRMARLNDHKFSGIQQFTKASIYQYRTRPTSLPYMSIYYFLQPLIE